MHYGAGAKIGTWSTGMTGRTCTQQGGDTSLALTAGTTALTERTKSDRTGNHRGGAGVIDYLDADRLMQIGRVQ